MGFLPSTKDDLHGFSPDELNSHFAGVSTAQNGCERGIEHALASAAEDGFTFKEISLADVVIAISHFTSQALGEDGVPQSVVVKALPFIGPIITNIFNTSLSSGIFPSTWRKAHLVPLKKTVVPSTVSDFRPIALLSFLSKVLEKIVHTQITEFLTSQKILDPLQTGFRQHNSTQTALLKLTEDIRAGINNKNKLLTILLLFDFSKAFDTISPTKLIQKLSKMAFSRSVLLWIRSYLTGRAQRVVSRSSGQSDWLETNLGVPQGSVLGPLLFSLYINDISNTLNPTHINNNTVRINHILYADDLQIYVQTPCDKLTESIAHLEAAAHAVSTWARMSDLNLNVKKTKAIIFGSEYNVNYAKELQLPGIEMENGMFVPFADSVTNLGVVLDSKLTWKHHVDHITKRVNRALYGLKLFKACTTEALRKQLASALVVPHMDYCCIVYLDVIKDLRKKL